MRAAALAALLVILAIGAALWMPSVDRARRQPAKHAPEQRPEPVPNADSAHVVVDPEGNPLADVLVFWEEEGEHNLLTDGDGRFEFTGQNEYLSFDRQGYAQLQAWASRKRFVLEPERTLTARVVDAGGQPVEGVWIAAKRMASKYSAALTYPSYQLEFTSGPGGLVFLNRLPTCRVVFWIGGEEFKNWIIDGEEVTAMAGDQDVRIVVHPVRGLRGRVVDSAGRPVAHASIYAANEAWAENTGANGQVRLAGLLASSDANGEFEIRDRSGRELTVFADYDGRRSESRSVTIPAVEGSNTDDLVLADEPTHRSFVRLRVHAAGGEPVAVTWSRAAYLPPSAVRNADGTAALAPMGTNPASQGLVASYFYSATRSPGEDGTILYEFPFDAGTPIEFHVNVGGDYLPEHVVASTSIEAETVDVRLRKGVHCRVRAVGGWAYGLELAGPCRRVAIDDGGYARYIVDPDATYRVFVKALEGVVLADPAWRPPQPDRPISFHYRKPEFPDPGELPPVPLRVYDHDGRPLANADCQLLRPQEPLGESFAASITDIDGRVSLPVSKAWRFRITAPGRGTIVVDGSRPEVHLSRAARILTRLALPGRWRLSDWRIEVQPESWPWPHRYRAYKRGVDRVKWSTAWWTSEYEEMYRWNAEHTLPSGATGLLEDLPPGPCRVRLYTDSYEEVMNVTLREGETTTVEFR